MCHTIAVVFALFPALIYIRKLIYFSIYKFDELKEAVEEGKILGDFYESSYLWSRILQVKKENFFAVLAWVTLLTIYVGSFSILMSIPLLIIAGIVYNLFWRGVREHEEFKQSIVDIIQEKSDEILNKEKEDEENEI